MCASVTVSYGAPKSKATISEGAAIPSPRHNTPARRTNPGALVFGSPTGRLPIRKWSPVSKCGAARTRQPAAR